MRPTTTVLRALGPAVLMTLLGVAAGYASAAHPERGPVTRACANLYRNAHSAADSAVVDTRTPILFSRAGAWPCGANGRGSVHTREQPGLTRR